MGFRFAMASVLRWREGVEKREELVLQQMQFEVNRIAHRIEEITEEIAQANQRQEAALRNWTQAFDLKGMKDEVCAAAEARKILIETLAALKKQKDAQMEVYRAARMSRRMLTDLEAQKRTAWEQTQDRADQKRLDDVFTARMIRN